MKGDYLSSLAKMLLARELGNAVRENDLLDELDDLWEEMTYTQRAKINLLSSKIARREVSRPELPYWRRYVYARNEGPLVGVDIPGLDGICARHSRKACLMRRKTSESRPARRKPRVPQLAKGHYPHLPSEISASLGNRSLGFR